MLFNYVYLSKFKAMKNFEKYSKDLKNALRNSYDNSKEPDKSKKLAETEKYFDKFCIEYFDGIVFNREEYKEFIRINKSFCEDFVSEVEPGLK